MRKSRYWTLMGFASLAMVVVFAFFGDDLGMRFSGLVALVCLAASDILQHLEARK